MQLNLTTTTTTDTLEYELMETPPASALAGRPIYVAKIVHRKTVNLLSLAERLAKETPYRVDDVVHILSSLADVLQDELAQGHSINLGSLLQMTPTIHGTFDSPTEAFDPTKQRVVVKACTGKLLRNAAAEIKTKNVTLPNPPDPDPTPRSDEDAPPTPTSVNRAAPIAKDVTNAWIEQSKPDSTLCATPPTRYSELSAWST